MGFVSLILSVGGIVTTLIYHVNSNIILGIISGVLLLAAMLIGQFDMKKQEKNGGINTEMFNPGMLGHGMGGTALILMIVMFIIDRIG